MSVPRVAVGPYPSDFATDAVRAGGGTVVDLTDSPDSLVWLDPTDVPGLAAWLEQVPAARWVQLPFAGVERVAEAGLLDEVRIWTCAKGAYAEPVASLWPWPACATSRPESRPDRGGSRPGPACTTARSPSWAEEASPLRSFSSWRRSGSRRPWSAATRHRCPERPG
jgi:hypothetical protein